MYCHEGSIKVCSVGGVTLYAAGKSRQPTFKKATTIVDLTSSPITFKLWKLPVGWLCGPLQYEPTVINLPLVDGAAPWNVGLDFWTALWQDFIKEAGGEKHGVLLICQGGHGRTGTVACAMMRAAGVKGDVVSLLRERYCEKAVENEQQMEYLADIGVKTTCKPSSAYVQTSAYVQKMEHLEDINPSSAYVQKSHMKSGLLYCNGLSNTCVMEAGHKGVCISSHAYNNKKEGRKDTILAPIKQAFFHD